MDGARTLTMSVKELDRLEVLGRVIESRWTQQLATIWGRKPMLLASSAPAFESIVAALDRHGIESFLLLRRPAAGGGPDRLAGKARCELDSRFRVRGAPYVFDVDLYACTIGAGHRR